MKTVEELYNEIIASEQLKNEFLDAAKNKQIEAFMKKYDCGATNGEVTLFLRDKSEGELSDDELDMVSAGAGCDDITRVMTSITGVRTGCFR